jgi:NAD(P) transhydrogenase subunit alpha
MSLKKNRKNCLTETLKKIDIIICTALIPGREAPKIIKEDMFKNLQPGSVIYDLAAAFKEGTQLFTEVNKIVEKDGVKILGRGKYIKQITCISF